MVRLGVSCRDPRAARGCWCHTSHPAPLSTAAMSNSRQAGKGNVVRRDRPTRSRRGHTPLRQLLWWRRALAAAPPTAGSLRRHQNDQSAARAAQPRHRDRLLYQQGSGRQLSTHCSGSAAEESDQPRPRLSVSRVRREGQGCRVLDDLFIPWYNETDCWCDTTNMCGLFTPWLPRRT